MAEPEQVPQLPPMLIVPATGLNIQGDGSRGVPIVRLTLVNPIAHCTFALDEEQAKQHIDNVRSALLEAKRIVIPERKIELP
jgi:hypothetical protein